MKHYKKSRTFAFVPALLAIIGFAVSCADSIEVDYTNPGKYESANHPYGYIQNAIAPSQRLVDLYQSDVERKIEIGLTKAVHHAVDMTVTVDESVLTAYNKANDHNFPMLPAELVAISQDGIVVVPPGYLKADPLTVTISPSAELEEGKTYAVPLRISTDDADVKLSDAQKGYVFFVVAQGKRISAEKSAGYKVMSCMETGDADPRIHCELLLKNEGKPITDMVALFSANLNYNAAEGKVYIHMNNSITPILNNRDRYIKPLQDMGIKVLLGLMGNWDPAGVAHLQPETAKAFAQDVKAAVEAYGLDGVFWDDEYTTANGSIPGFSSSNRTNASRLIFEVKRAMPDKINSFFVWGSLYGLNVIDGVQPGDYIDYIVPNYGSSVSLGNFPGSTAKQGMPRPYEFALQSTGSPSTVVSGNWGGIMVFALSEHRNNWNSFQLPALRTIASTMYGDELVYTGVSYPMEW